MSSQKRKRNDECGGMTLSGMTASEWQMPPSGAPCDNIFWTHERYRGPNREKVKVRYCRSLEECDSALASLFGSRVFGFDMEWKPFSGGRLKDQISVIQIAVDSEIVVVHLAAFPGEDPEDLVSPTLRSFLENADFVKIGHKITGDGTRLRKNLHINPQGFTEVATLRLEIDTPTNTLSLASLVETYFGLRLDKDLAASKWHRDTPLTSSQRRYAAADAYAGLKLFQHFTSSEHTVTLQIVDYYAKEQRERKKTKSSRQILLERLKDLRTMCMREDDIIAVQFASNDVLGHIVNERPTTVTMLRQIPGMKPFSIRDYGKDILDLIRGHTEAFPLLDNAAPSSSWPDGSQDLASEATSDILAGFAFVFMGTFQAMTHKRGQQLVRSHGGRVTTAVSKNTDYVVLGYNLDVRKLEEIGRYTAKRMDEEGFRQMMDSYSFEKGTDNDTERHEQQEDDIDSSSSRDTFTSSQDLSSQDF